VIDEEAELGLVSLPMRWPVESKGQKEDVDGRGKSRLRKEESGPKSKRERAFEEGRNPGERKGEWDSRRADVAGGRGHPDELEAGGHREHRDEDQPCDKNCNLAHTASLSEREKLVIGSAGT